MSIRGPVPASLRSTDTESDGLLGMLALTALSGTAFAQATLVEWTLPTGGSLPSHVIAGRGSTVYIAERGAGKVGVFDLATGTLTDWVLPGTQVGGAPAAPHDLQLRGVNLFVGDQTGRIIRFNTQTGVAFVWTIPNQVITHLDVVDNTVFFASRQGGTLGSLNIDTGVVRVWNMGTPANDVKVVGNQLWYSGYTQGTVGTLDVQTGAVTEYAVVPGKEIDHVEADGAFLYYGGFSEVGRVNTLTHQVTRWGLPDFGSAFGAGITDQALRSDATMLVAEAVDNQIAVVALSVGSASQSFVSPATRTATYADFAVAPVRFSLVKNTTTLTPTSTTLYGSGTSAYTEYTLPTANSYPVSIIDLHDGSVALTERNSGRIAWIH